MGTSSSPGGIYTRGAALPGLCGSNGCSWQIVNGVSTYVCCCSQNLCNAEVPSLTTTRPSGTNCYYCSTCPQPFNPSSPYVSQIYSPSNWCAMMSLSNSPGAIDSRGAAQPGLCNYNGCSWQNVNGVSTYVCCCSQSLCNAEIPSLTTTRPSGTNCYYCSTCPQPFDPYSSSVSQVYSTSNWCATTGTSNSPSGIYSRGVAQPGLCSSNGCSWQYVNGVYMYVCCCSQNLCNAEIPSLTTTRPSGTNCYYCLTCPQPFDPYSSSVSQVYSTSNWCATMGTSNSPGGIYNRGPAPTNLCSSNGCSWQYVNGIYTYVCCCSENLCNAEVPSLTTTRPSGTTCYYCSTCPQPFRPHASGVSQVSSTTGWCASMTTSSSSNAPYTLDAAQQDLCNNNGCSWVIYNGVSTRVCCCYGYLCNTAVSISKSTIGILSAALIMIIMAHKNF